jgi:hypothetical protein
MQRVRSDPHRKETGLPRIRRLRCDDMPAAAVLLDSAGVGVLPGHQALLPEVRGQSGKEVRGGLLRMIMLKYVRC